eukprot:TRINITY_DN4841_c0_g1_i1.p1 TRINITY_DN4841_c0_g1~~TRINITY_DN4841_c0_g1_i1.p1  ORF type:complete len:151 (-),score=37.41 TRINITY_DN4841_c0_g1_i1:396-809(-)
MENLTRSEITVSSPSKQFEEIKKIDEPKSLDYNKLIPPVQKQLSADEMKTQLLAEKLERMRKSGDNNSLRSSIDRSTPESRSRSSSIDQARPFDLVQLVSAMKNNVEKEDRLLHKYSILNQLFFMLKFKLKDSFAPK